MNRLKVECQQDSVPNRAFYGVSPQYFYQGFSSNCRRTEKRKSDVIFHNPSKALHILLVEDDPADELIMRRALDASNHKINIFVFMMALKPLIFFDIRKI